MASLIVDPPPRSRIDYSIADGHVRLLVIGGETLYDEEAGVSADGWLDRLAEFVVEQALDVDPSGIGLHAFLDWMHDAVDAAIRRRDER
jgi:hypothetical protein